MTRLADNTFVPSLRGPQAIKFVPFTVFARIIPDPGFGRRFETVRSMERIADSAEDVLRTLQESNTDDSRFDFAYPVKSTPQFGDKTARITIHGNADLAGNFTKLPMEEKVVISSGEFVTGPGAQNAQKIPSDEVNDAVKELKDLIESSTGLEVFKIEIAHVIYGSDGGQKPGHGFHFPR